MYHTNLSCETRLSVAIEFMLIPIMKHQCEYCDLKLIESFDFEKTPYKNNRVYRVPGIDLGNVYSNRINLIQENKT